ncbi:unnamed protein product [Prorocentrum cordatum]|uniref:Nuclease associated modular domain-containing protein n=1 Tax=Prorocentrum cordatum TaxID=2364126 RepID=A0ABN9UKX9_9DINO|nr:unnamed protein product [Polarella glacialis]
MILHRPFKLRAALRCARNEPCYRKVAPCGGRQVSIPLCSSVSPWKGPLSGPTLIDAVAACCTQIETGPLGRHYTYALRGSLTGLWYIGSRTCPDVVSSPEADIHYMGSPRNMHFKQERKAKLILTRHKTRGDALAAECFLHDFYNVGKNPEFANRAKQTSVGFSTQGIKLRDSTKQKISEAKRGERNPMFGKHHSEVTRQKMSEAGRGKVLSEETKQKIREARRGKVLSEETNEETKQKIREARRGKVLSEETKQKLNQAMFGKHHSEKTRQKMSEARRGKVLSEETKQKIREAQRGKVLSEETRQKISEAMRGERNPMFGKHHSEETKQKISVGIRGKPRSEETKQKLSEATREDRHPVLGRHRVDNTMQKMSEARRGKVLSEETKQKLSETTREDLHPLLGRHRAIEESREVWRRSRS